MRDSYDLFGVGRFSRQTTDLIGSPILGAATLFIAVVFGLTGYFVVAGIVGVLAIFFFWCTWKFREQPAQTRAARAELLGLVAVPVEAGDALPPYCIHCDRPTDRTTRVSEQGGADRTSKAAAAPRWRELPICKQCRGVASDMTVAKHGNQTVVYVSKAYAKRLQG